MSASIARQIEALEEKIEALEQQIEAFKKLIEEAKDPGEREELRDERHQLRDEREQLQDRQQQLWDALLNQTTPAAITLQAAPVSKLLDVYGEQLQRARCFHRMPETRVPTCKLPLLDNGGLCTDLGDYFTLVGREETIQHLMAAAARVFGTFMNTTANASDIEQREFLLMLIGFPGAGKTTVGTCLSALLREAWERDTKTGDIDGLVEDQLGDKGLVKQFKEMVNNVLETGRELTMYHSVETTRAGHVTPLENGLAAEQVLALRCFHAALCPVNTTGYGGFLRQLDDKFPGLRDVLTLGDVIDFIRTGLKVPADKRIFLSWFFDDVNKAQPQHGGPPTSSWIHDAFSAYVQHIKDNRGGLTFPILTAATTEFAGATMRYTSTEKALSIFIPIRPLKEQEVVRVTKIFLTRLGNTLDMEKPFELKDGLRNLIKLSGGNPRMLVHLLRGLMPDLDASKFYEKVNQDLTQIDLRNTITTAWGDIKRGFYYRYLKDEKYLLVLRAFYVALLGTLISREELVWPGSRYEDNWGSLESYGLVGLLRNEELLSNKKIKLSRDEDAAFSIMFSPLLIYHLVENLHVAELQDLCPSKLISNPKNKEVSDLMSIVLMIYMLRLFHDRERKGTVFEFRLQEILPSNFHIPASMQALKFRVPAGAKFGRPTHQPHQIYTADVFQAFLSDNSQQFYWVGVGNHGPDSIIHLQLVDAENKLQDFFLFIESKHRDVYEGQQANWEETFEKKILTIKQWMNEGENYAMVFMTDQAMGNLISKIKKPERMVVLVPKVHECLYGYPAQSPFGLLGAVCFDLVYKPSNEQDDSFDEEPSTKRSRWCF